MTLTWVKGYDRCPGNEAVDRLAAEGTGKKKTTHDGDEADTPGAKLNNIMQGIMSLRNIMQDITTLDCKIIRSLKMAQPTS
jgi:hypothetical protein